MNEARIRERRLARFRLHQQTRPGPPGQRDADPAHPRPFPSSLDSPVARERARQLAGSLRGRLLTTPTGVVVETETRVRLPADLAALGRLPYPIDPGRPLVFLDTETTGLGTAAGTLPFLVGLGSWEGDEFRVRQLFLPDQSDEPAFLDVLAAAIPPDAWLVTYNGRAFDWPLVVTRYRLRHRAPPTHAGHLDLLPVARQVWRHRLQDARLSTVEVGVAGVVRRHDLPGALVPARYFAYLRSGRPSLLLDVARHNLQDVVSLARLLEVLCRALRDDARSPLVDPGDLLGLAHAFARQHRHHEALQCLDRAVASANAAAAAVAGGRPVLVERIAADRARALARTGRHHEALEAWLRLAERGGPFAAFAWLQVAKYREHMMRDVIGALHATERAGALAERARAFGRPLRSVERDLPRRLHRLRCADVMRARGAPELAQPVAERHGIGQPRQADPLDAEARDDGSDEQRALRRKRRRAEGAAGEPRRDPGRQERVTGTRRVPDRPCRYCRQSPALEPIQGPGQMERAAFAQRDHDLLMRPRKQLDQPSAT